MRRNFIKDDVAGGIKVEFGSGEAIDGEGWNDRADSFIDRQCGEGGGYIADVGVVTGEIVDGGAM